jgi:hypothetical protein
MLIEILNGHRAVVANEPEGTNGKGKRRHTRMRAVCQKYRVIQGYKRLQAITSDYKQ